MQFAYYALLIRSYGIGDMSVVYPLARGLAPVLTTLAAFLVIGETLSTGQIMAVALISFGIMVLSFGAGASRAAVGFALATGATVAAYSFLAGMGVRSGGTVLGFQAWLEIVNGVVMVGFALLDAARGVRRLCPPSCRDRPAGRRRCRWSASSPISRRPGACRSGRSRRCARPA